MTEQETEFLIEPEINQNHTLNRQQSNPSMSLAPRIFKMGLIFTASTFWLYYSKFSNDKNVIKMFQNLHKTNFLIFITRSSPRWKLDLIVARYFRLVKPVLNL